MIRDNFLWVETQSGNCPVYTLFPEKSCPAVLFCHDYKGNSHESNRFFWKLSRALYNKGIGSVRFDYNGFGNSTGKATEFTIETGLNDTVSVFQHIAVLPEVDPENLAILGLGMGGRMAAYLLGNTIDIKAGILLNPADKHFKSEEELEELQFGFEGDTAWDEGWELSKKFFSYDNFGEGSSEIKETEAPVLIISGFDDEFIFHKTSEKYAQELPSAKLEELMDADHFFSSPEAEIEVERLITTFLGKILLGLEEVPAKEKSQTLEELEISKAPPLANAIEHAEIAEPEIKEKLPPKPESEDAQKKVNDEEEQKTISGSEVVIKEKLPPSLKEEEKSN